MSCGRAQMRLPQPQRDVGGKVSRTPDQMVPVKLGESDWLAPGYFQTIFLTLG